MIAEVQKAIRVYVRRFGARPWALYVSRAGRSDLWRAMAPPEDPEPPLYMPIYVEGIPVWAMAGVDEGSVDAVHDPRPVRDIDVGQAPSDAAARSPHGVSGP